MRKPRALLLHMLCLCGNKLPVKDTGKQGDAHVWCSVCREVYDYSCWLSKTLDYGRGFVHTVEAFPRGVTEAGRSPRCGECADCQEWLLTPDQAGRCSRRPATATTRVRRAVET